MSLPNELRELLKDDIKHFDAIIVGDGSGSKRPFSGGWASILVDCETEQLKLFYGAANDTTVNLSELFPHVHAVQWYCTGPGKLKQSRDFFKQVNVALITDCEIIAKQGNNESAKVTNAAIWAVFEHYARSGFMFKWYHIPRESLALNSFCDRLSKTMRKLVDGIDAKLSDLDKISEEIPNVGERSAESGSA